MRRAALSGVLLLAACPPARVERAARVVIELDRGLRSRCLQLELEAGASTYSQPLVLTGKTPLVAGVPQGRLGDTVRVRALGFVDEACGERAREESDFATLTFVDDAVTEVRLRVTARAPRTETRCADGADDDGDGRVDCADADCDDAPCAAADRCLVSPRCAGGACRSQAVRQCRSPPTTCFAPEGACAPTDGTCSYTVAVTNTCTDQDACTTNDACQGDGGCAGTPLACPANTTLSCRASAGTCANGGCTYALTPDAGCDDGDRCTLDDRCSALGACSGVPVSCPARTCAVFTNQCGDGGACLYAPVSPGTPCDGGVCSRAGECLPRFPYQPLNFEVVAAPAPPLAPTVLDCGEVVLDSSGAAPGRPVSWCQGQPFQASLVGLDGGSEALLVSFSGLVLARDAGLRLVGDRPVIFAVFGDATLAGAVVAEGADRTCGGGSTNGAAGSAGNGGGAGGSFASAGGAGGDGTAASGGTASAVEPNLGPTPLRGGCRGGRGGDQASPAARGGGAFQLSAAGEVTLSGTVAAPGRGGAGGANGSLIRLPTAGNGGGSGGLVVLEAARVRVAGGAITANGGGGGEGATVTADGAGGATGALSAATPAPGGDGQPLFGRRGGNGAAGATSATAGQSSIIGGGGGGGLGLVFLHATSSCSLGAGAVISPTHNRDGGCP